MKKNKKKIFVLDTNVILHDYKSIFTFEKNDVVIPITVLEELDKFKKGNDQIHYHAREFMRQLDKLSKDHLLTEGIPLGKDLGALFIETGKEFSANMKDSHLEDIPDHRIVAVAHYCNQTSENREVILVTQDINLRMKAKSLGLKAQDYETGKVRNIAKLYKNITVIENIDNELISSLYKEPEGVAVEKLAFDKKPKPNQYFILKGNKSSALSRYNYTEKTLTRVEKFRTYGITPRNAEQTFAIDALLNNNVSLVTLTGKAGTGKTLLALAAALHQHQKFNQIFLARPIVPLANRDLGFLPGNVKDKISPYMQPLFDNLSVIKHKLDINSNDYRRIDEMLENEELLISPLAYIRGRSLSGVYFIVDEAQNLTPHEIKTIITRAGEGTKMVFTGDIHQIDSPYLDSRSNGLSYLTDRMKGQEIFAHVNLVKGERSFLADLASDLL